MELKKGSYIITLTVGAQALNLKNSVGIFQVFYHFGFERVAQNELQFHSSSTFHLVSFS